MVGGKGAETLESGWVGEATLYEAASEYLNLLNFLKHHTLLSQRTVLTLAFPFFRSQWLMRQWKCLSKGLSFALLCEVEHCAGSWGSLPRKGGCAD